MSARGALAAALLAAAWLAVWQAELIRVDRGAAPRPLERLEMRRGPVRLDVALAAVPIGLERLRARDGVLLVHYWAPWERDGLAQAVALDSLRRVPGMEQVRVAVVCFDPFPSVARYIARHRLRLLVLLDGPGALRRTLPCPSLPYSYVIDRDGSLVVAQAGAVDWLAPTTRALLMSLVGDGNRERPPA